MCSVSMFCRFCSDKRLIQSYQPFSWSPVGYSIPGQFTFYRAGRTKRCYFRFSLTVSVVCELFSLPVRAPSRFRRWGYCIPELDHLLYRCSIVPSVRCALASFARGFRDRLWLKLVHFVRGPTSPGSSTVVGPSGERHLWVEVPKPARLLFADRSRSPKKILLLVFVSFHLSFFSFVGLRPLLVHLPSFLYRSVWISVVIPCHVEKLINFDVFSVVKLSWAHFWLFANFHIMDWDVNSSIAIKFMAVVQ